MSTVFIRPLTVLPLAAGMFSTVLTGVLVRLSAGDDRAGDHHDAEAMDEAGKALAKRRLPEGATGISQPHRLIGGFPGEGADDSEVMAGIETGRGPRAAAPPAAGHRVFPVDPLPASRHRGRHGVPGAKSDAGDARMPADMVRTGSRQLREAAGDPAAAEGIRVPARTHETMIRERTRGAQRPRHQLREYLPAAPGAFDDPDAPGTRELPGRAPEPDRARRLTGARVGAALKRARRRNVPDRAGAILAAPRSGQLARPAARTAARAAAVRSLIAVIAVLNERVKTLEARVREHSGRHPDAAACPSRPGMGAIPGARVLAESGGDPHRCAGGRARRDHAAAGPVTRASGRKKAVAARFVRNDRLVDALSARAFAALRASPGARAFCDELRAREIEHDDALRRLANRLAGILHGCLETGTLCGEATAWGHRQNLPRSSAAA